MNLAAATALTSGFKTDAIEWQRIVGSPRFDYPIDYWVAVLGVQPEQGRIDFLSKWEPNAYCHYHRHLGPTTLLVLEGEHHVVEHLSPRLGNGSGAANAGFGGFRPDRIRHSDSPQSL